MEVAFRATPERSWQVCLDGGPWASFDGVESLVRRIAPSGAPPARLRFRPDSLDAPGAIPVEIATTWKRLKGDYGIHLTRMGCTVSEVSGWPREQISTHGGVFVIEAEAGDAPKLSRMLRDHILPPIRPVTLVEAPDISPGSLVIVEPRLGETEVRQLQQLSEDNHWALVIWCTTTPVSYGAVEIVWVDGEWNREAGAVWLAAVISRLRGGLDPEQAFALAAADHGYGHWLRGRCLGPERWALDQNPDIAVPLRFLPFLDRTEQEKALTRLATKLLVDASSLRVVVVVTPGPPSSGLEMFRRRPLVLPRDLKFHDAGARDVRWANDRAAEIDVLLQHFQCPLREALPRYLRAEAQRVGVNAPVLFELHHMTIGPRPHRPVEAIISDLGAYVEDLQWLASKLDPSVRVLVHVSLEAISADEVRAAIERTTPSFELRVLKDLPPGVPTDELKDWLDHQNLPHDAEMLERLSKLSYHELTDWLLKNLPNLARS